MQNKKKYDIVLSQYGKILGGGSDKVGAFEIQGILMKWQCSDRKAYVGKHIVEYKGSLNAGRWYLTNGVNDEFQLNIP